MEAGTASTWAQTHFGHAALGNISRTRRLVQVAGRMAQASGGTICGVLRDPHQAKAAYRLFDRPEITHEAVTAPHFQLTRQAADQHPLCLMIEDTTALDFHGLQAAQGLGPIGEAYTRGLWVHSCLAVALDEATDQAQVLGLLGQRVWARPSPPLDQPKKKESPRPGPRRQGRESERWTAAIEQTQGPLGQCRWVYVADREGDIYENFQFCWAWGCSFVIRAGQARALTGPWPDLNLFQAAAQGRVLGQVKLEVAGRAAPARLTVQSLTLKLRGPTRPGGRLEDFELNVVRAYEKNPPAGQEPLAWVLLTDLPVATLQDCRRVLGIYRRRWLIEEWHKALKTGLKVEDSQLSTARRLMALVGVLSVVAGFLLQTKLQARGPAADEELDATMAHDSTVQVLKKLHPVQDAATWRWYWRSIAKLGGFLGRKGDGDPGWLTIWRGWQTLMVLARGYELANSS
jgi:hypothetical protein